MLSGEEKRAHPFFKSLLQLVHSHTKVEINTQGAILHKDISTGIIQVINIHDDLG